MTVIAVAQITISKIADGNDGSPTYVWVRYADDANGSGLSSSPTNKKYVGFAYNKSSPTASNTASDYTWSLFQGPQGVRGPSGADGAATYTWIKYADNASGSGMSDSPAGKKYIGIAVNKSTETESTNAADYNWSLIQGADGSPTYVWVRYADNASGSGISASPTNKSHIGFAYNKSTPTASNTASDYTWSLFQGPQGVPGPRGSDGNPTYTWIKYADNASGSGMSDSPTNKKYMGIAVNKTTEAESTNAADYTWSLIQGAAGATGPTGPPGQTLYTWVKYADSESGAGLTDTSIGKEFIGFAHNKTSATESTNPADYTWSKIKGDAGIFTEEPAVRNIGTLWIRKSNDPALPHQLVRWNGSAWVQQTLSLAELDPTQYEKLQAVTSSMNAMADDSILSQAERITVNDKIIAIAGKTLSATATLPTLLELDTGGKGEVWDVRRRATLAGLPINDAIYIGLETAYNQLRTYLNAMSPRPWDTTSKADLRIVYADWTRYWTNYYNAVFLMNEATIGLLNGRVTQTEEDINNPEAGLLAKLSEVEMKTLSDSIVATVTTSDEFRLSLEGKANTEDLANYSTADELQMALAAVYEEMAERIGNIDMSTFVTQSQMEQTSKEFNFKISSGGGVNLIKNSTGFSGTDFWTATGTIETVADDELEARGAGSGFLFNNGTLKQTVLVTSEMHTFSVIVKKGSTGTGYLKVTDESQTPLTIPFNAGTVYDYDRYSINIFPMGNQIDVELYGSAGSGLILTGAMGNIGPDPLQWQHSPGEVYNTNVLMDMNGIRVKSSAYNGWTAITPEEFAGYAEVDGVMTRVFTLNKEVTEMTKIDIDDEINMNPIKIIPIKSTAYNGWAFIASD